MNNTKVTILHVSLNPKCYNVKKIAEMDYDTALKFCQRDRVLCMTWGETIVDLDHPHVTKIHCDGAYSSQHDTDAMLNWIKVEKC